MNTDTTIKKEIHQGENVKRIREVRGIKQEALGHAIDYSQQSISRLEGKQKIKDELLEKMAKEMNVPVEAIKSFDEEKAINIVSNTFQDDAAGYNKCTFNSLEKMVELYERIIKEKEEKIILLEQLLKEKELILEYYGKKDS
jgi:transcriptional regulator with XRE-family HTH domain